MKSQNHAGGHPPRLLLARPHRSLRVGGRLAAVRGRKHRVWRGQRLLSEPLVLQRGCGGDAALWVQRQHGQQQVQERVGAGEGPAAGGARQVAGARTLRRTAVLGYHRWYTAAHVAAACMLVARDPRAASTWQPGHECGEQGSELAWPAAGAPQQRAVLPHHLLQVGGAVLGLALAAAPRVVAPVPQQVHPGPGALRARVAQPSKDPAQPRRNRWWVEVVRRCARNANAAAPGAQPQPRLGPLGVCTALQKCLYKPSLPTC